jgi:cobalt-zinc-cadmium efflux system outer membrane protein
MHASGRQGAVAVLWAALAGCASTSPATAFRDVAQQTMAQGGHRVIWDRNTVEDQQTAKAIDELLAHQLTADAAVQVALLASPHLRSTFEDLSVAQADLVQAGLLKNPVFTIGRTAWESEHINPNIFASVEQDFLELVTMPMRKRLAATQLETAKLEVADEVLKLSSEVRGAFYEAQAAQQVAAMRRMVSEAAQTSADLAGRQADAGNMSELSLSSERGLASQARLDLRRSETDAALARERLGKLMGVWGARTLWRLGERLPELPKREVSLARLESTAIGQRLDVAAARRELQSLQYASSLASTTRWTGVISVDVQAGRLRGSRRIALGPSVSLEIPLFDQRQAALARLDAFKRQAQDNLEALAIDVRSDVRSARVRLTAARAIVDEYRNVLVPLREDAVRLSQQSYDAMLLGVYQLIQAKQLEFQTYREYIEALRDYWIARSDLERAIGTRLTEETAQSPVVPTTARQASPTTMDPRSRR